MLTCQQCGGHQNRHLIACTDRNECRAHGDFCFTKAHITTHQPVHRLVLLHIMHHCMDGIGLVGRLFKGKLTGKQIILRHVYFKMNAHFRLTPCLHVQQLCRHIMDLL